MSTTPNLGLQLTSSSESSVYFKDWVDGLTGNGNDSNMNILDREVGNAKTTLNNHTSNLVVHVSSDDKLVWNKKANIVRGYLYEGSFYQDAQHGTMLTPSESAVYVDITDGSNILYIWDTVVEAYDPIAGEGGSGSDYGTWG